MDRYGSDKPDIRFGMEIMNVSDLLKDTALSVFQEAAAKGSIRLINAKGLAGKIPRKQIDSLAEYVKTYRAKGLAWVRLLENQVNCSFAKFISDEQLKALLSAAGAEDGDLLFLIADTDNQTAQVAMGSLRLEVARRFGLIDETKLGLLWVVEFPLLEYDAEAGRFSAMHHPFTAPFDEDLPLLESDPGAVRAKAYDIVFNGVELGGGSIRIHRTDVQQRMFAALGFTPEGAYAQFGHLLDAFRYGAPPHGGLAYGLDRICMLLAGRDSIRDVIAFPKVQNASELMTSCPSSVAQDQLDELGLALTVQPETQN